MEYHDELSKIPCVANGDKEQFLTCLETIISRLRINENELEFQTSKYDDPSNAYIDKNKFVSKEYIISDTLYRSYDDQAIPFLIDDYTELKDIKKESYDENENFDFKIYNKNFYQSHCD